MQTFWGKYFILILRERDFLFSVLRHTPLSRITSQPYSKVFYEIGEHIGRDRSPFLHTESFQILDVLRHQQVFNGIEVRRLRWPLHQLAHLATGSINHFFVDFDVCSWLWFCCKIHLQPSFSLLAEATKFLPKMS